MTNLVHTVTPEDGEGVIGLDSFGQLMWERKEGTSTIMSPIADPRGETCPICNRGWDSTTKSIVDQHYWQNHRKWAHETCFVRYLGLTEKSMWIKILVEAKIRFDGLEEISNGYGGGYDTPWYVCQPLDATPKIMMGSRRRVWNMEILVNGYPIDLEAIKAVFDKESVTKGIERDRVFIHAWTEEKAQEYMNAFAKALGLPKPRELQRDVQRNTR